MSLEGVIRSNGKKPVAKKPAAKNPAAKTPAAKTSAVKPAVKASAESASVKSTSVKPETKTAADIKADASAVTGQKIYGITDELPVYLL